jgi:hypothetical protein
MSLRYISKSASVKNTSFAILSILRIERGDVNWMKVNYRKKRSKFGDKMQRVGLVRDAWQCDAWQYYALTLAAEVGIIDLHE